MKAVLVTGAAQGIGASICEVMADEGWRVFATDVVGEVLHPAHADDDRIVTIEMDVTDVASIEAARTTIEGHTDGLDGIVNNAGIAEGGAILETSVERYERIISINAIGPHRVTHLMLPLLLARKGRIVSMSSESVKGVLGFQTYALSKKLLDAWGKAVRQEAQMLGMESILIRPGAHATALLEGSKDRLAEGERDTSSLFHQQLANQARLAKGPMEKTSDPRDVALAVRDALTADKPKLVYNVNQSPQLTAMAAMPQRLRDRVIRFALR